MSVFTEISSKNGVNFVNLKNVSSFDVRKIFDCGQCFRFEPVENTEHEAEFSGIAHGRFISVAQDGRDVYIYNVTEAEYNELWRSYLGLDEDYGAIHKELLSLSQSPALGLAVEHGKGIRILKQDPWEAICSFIISQNNNIPRIKGLIRALSERAGERIGEGVYAFPEAKAVADLGEEGLRALKVGFRAPYILDAAKKVAEGELDFEKIRQMTTADAERELCRVKGIGPKVADCALLFGFGKYDAFPVDVWIKRVIAKYFDEGFKPANLGRYAGIAQQVLFYYERYLQN
jgi:N-glycosylase/DNA lyase